MGLLSPLFLIGALAAAIPVALHLLKRQPEALVRFSAVRMLRAAPVEHASRRQLREVLLLALRVAVLAFCAVAFARPFLTSGVTSGDALVVALDTSFSMSGAGRFERARALAVAAIDGASRGTAVAVVIFDETARVASALSSDRSLARAAIAAAQPAFGATRYGAAVSTTADLMRGRRGRVLLVTDLQARGWDPNDHVSLPAAVDFTIADIGPPAGNLAVTSMRLAGDRIAATVRNSGAAPVDVRVQLAAGNGIAVAAAPTAAELSVTVDAGAFAEVMFPRPSGQWASVRVDDRDGAAADDVRYAVLNGGSRPRVLLITATGDVEHDAFYLERALTAAGAEGPASFEVAGVAASALQGWDQARCDAHAALILASTRGLERHGRELIRHFVEHGGGLLVTVGSDVDGDVLSESVGGSAVNVIPPAPQSRTVRTLAATDGRHPLLRPFLGAASLGLVRFDQVSTIRANGCAPLARFTSGETALLECESGGGRALLFASDLDNRGNDFPRHATFLPFVHEAIRYLAGDRPSQEYLVGDVPAGVPPVPGVATAVGLVGSSDAVVAVNVDPAESEPARLSVEEFEHVIVRTDERPDAASRDTMREREAAQHLWQYVLFGVLLLLAAESIVAMRVA